MLRRQKHALSQSTTPFACTLGKKGAVETGVKSGQKKAHKPLELEAKKAHEP